MTEPSRRSFVRAAVLGGAMAGGAVLLSAGQAQAADCPEHHKPEPRPCGCPTAPGLGGAGLPRFQLRVVNNSTQYQDLCVLQSPGDPRSSDMLSLAWLTKPAWPSTVVTFTWTDTYNFVWGQTGPLTPGTIFRAGQTWDADPTNPDRQQVQLDYARGAFTFLQGPATPNPRPGSLYIKELASIPVDTGAVGIGMSGAGTFVVPARPNLDLVFTPQPRYWVTAGAFVTGEVLDIERFTNSAAVEFPPGVYSMLATLRPDNTWTVQPDPA